MHQRARRADQSNVASIQIYVNCCRPASAQTYVAFDPRQRESVRAYPKCAATAREAAHIQARKGLDRELPRPASGKGGKEEPHSMREMDFRAHFFERIRGNTRQEFRSRGGQLPQLRAVMSTLLRGQVSLLENVHSEGWQHIPGLHGERQPPVACLGQPAGCPRPSV